MNLKTGRTKHSLIRDTIDEIKSTCGCQLCGESDAACLDFHHKDASTKENDISGLLQQKKFDKLAIEIEKCVVVCANCHRKIHRYNLDISHLQCCTVDKSIFQRLCQYRKNIEKILWPSNTDLAIMVWKEPAEVIAIRLGVSGRSVGKRCAKFNIPRPGRGYWAKVQSMN